ncbi:N-acyl-L-amino acid amidohydrolase [Alteromonas australica]|jgi:amidohydrolase|uniref:N-acyl-L-amino acid amidohydrolase n=1 Tax=Alteromonas australica TaxID=589873 RepID=A0A075NW01_9ALTE|nr:MULTISPECIES: amidohydrolase [Alteromonas]MAO30078.1 amidohydrolase [Alteromonas sp.]AIF97663.1 N-acyl-L-amino acid amidohydrolase [Alteromonas australica]AJP42762.1 N-acyl-L-amino acid amidohydrolase [Alteromonas australica]QPL49620.1 amidohydrolase [Alteromonas sp. B31-7]HBF71585.1 amidohydrolase [Alteromonas australica]|tara:strand:+ start:1912 stop:3201 length:1290 start_codon:yes stop_codon:yes gene_type:complete
MHKKIISLTLLAFSTLSFAQDKVEDLVSHVEPDVIKWRHHFHEFPELSNREFNTAKYIADYLNSLGFDVQTGVAKTGVIAILDSGKPGPVVALRADMDGLPVKEQSNLPYRSEQMGEYNGNEVPVMHACGHDTHMAMLMGAAKVLSELKGELKGKVKFIFQPAEEGAPAGEAGGAELMVKEGVLKNPDVDAIFGLHISSNADVGTIRYNSGGTMAAVDPFKIVIHGKQAHGAYPWKSVDPVVTAAQMIMSLQTIVSREIKLIDDAAVVTVGSIHGGNRSNIIPDSVELVGTIRTLNSAAREHIYDAMARKVKGIADSMGAKATLTLPLDFSYPITYNDPDLTQSMLPTMQRTAGVENTILSKPVTGAEDFSFFQEKVPGLYVWVGGKPLDVPEEESPAHHTPEFYVDDEGLKLGVELLTNFTLDYMAMH